MPLRLHTSIHLCRSCRPWRCCVAHALTVQAHLPASAAAPQVCGGRAPCLSDVVVCLTHCQCGVGPAAPQLRSRACRPANQSQLGRAGCSARSARARGGWHQGGHGSRRHHCAPAAGGTCALHAQQRCGYCGGVQLLPSSQKTNPPSSGLPCAGTKRHTPSTA